MATRIRSEHIRDETVSADDINGADASAIRTKLGIAENGATTIGYRGSFFDTTTQSVQDITSSYPVNIGSTHIARGISLVSGSYIRFDNAGDYNVQLNVQFINSASQDYNVGLWIRLTGSDIENSGLHATVPGRHGDEDGRLLTAWNFHHTFDTNDYIQIMWHADSIDIRIDSETSHVDPVMPATPGVNVNIRQIVGQLNNPLNAINQITSSADTFPYFTSATTATTASITSAGRSVVALAWSSGTQIPALIASGTSSLLSVGTGTNNIVQLDSSSRLPAVNASLLTNLTSSNIFYIPTTGSDWTDPDPSNVLTALDSCASRITSLESTPAGGVDIQIFTGSADWFKPVNAKFTTIILVAAGGGGGSGRSGNTSTTRSAGTGGGGGGCTILTLPSSLLNATESVTVPSTGGLGGLPITAINTPGSTGSAGGFASFGIWAYASGGVGGSGGTAGAVAAVAGGTGLYSGGTGAGSGNGTAGSVGGFGTAWAAGGGGSGGGITSSNLFTAGGSGGIGAVTSVGGSAGGSGGITGGATGSAGTSGITNTGFGGGGGGGGASAYNQGSVPTGGDGGFPGGGGGGGGAGTNIGAVANASGSGGGGNGAGAIAIIATTY